MYNMDNSSNMPKTTPEGLADWLLRNYNPPDKKK